MLHSLYFATEIQVAIQEKQQQLGKNNFGACVWQETTTKIEELLQQDSIDLHQKILMINLQDYISLEKLQYPTKFTENLIHKYGEEIKIKIYNQQILNSNQFNDENSDDSHSIKLQESSFESYDNLNSYSRNIKENEELNKQKTSIVWFFLIN
ncbi:hypothetical protein ABPG72_020053 [Tetrahymena utriculariae]